MVHYFDHFHPFHETALDKVFSPERADVMQEVLYIYSYVAMRC